MKGMSETTNPERRAERHPRTLLVHTVRRRDKQQEGALAVGRTLNVSTGGARVALEMPLPAGTELEVTLQLGNRLLDVAGVVVYCEPGNGRLPVVGIEFTDLSDDDQELLETHLERVAGGG